MKELCTIYNNCKAVGEGRYLARALSSMQIIGFGSAIRNSKDFVEDYNKVEGKSLRRFLSVLCDYKEVDSMYHHVTWKTNNNHLVSVVRNDTLGGYDIVIGTDDSDFFYNKIIEILNNSSMRYFPQGLLDKDIILKVTSHIKTWLTVGSFKKSHRFEHFNKKVSSSDIILNGILSYFKFLEVEIKEFDYCVSYLGVRFNEFTVLDDFYLLGIIDEINVAINVSIHSQKNEEIIKINDNVISDLGNSLVDKTKKEYLSDIIILEMYLRGYSQVETNKLEFKKSSDKYDYSLFNKQVIDVVI